MTQENPFLSFLIRSVTNLAVLFPRRAGDLLFQHNKEKVGLCLPWTGSENKGIDLQYSYCTADL